MVQAKEEWEEAWLVQRATKLKLYKNVQNIDPKKMVVILIL